MNICIIRHGQTDWNKENLFQGRSNIPLNSIGIEQAQKLAVSLKSKKIDFIFSSPLDRAIQTANIINQYHNIPLFIDEQIIERSLGDLEGKPSSQYNLPNLWNQILNLSQKEFSTYSVEPLVNLLERSSKFLNKLILKYGNSNSNIYIVAHGSINLALLLVLGKVDTSKPLHQFTIANCHCYTIKNPTIQYLL